MHSNPRVQLAVEVGSHETLVEKLERGAIDLLISRGALQSHDGHYRSMQLVDDGTVLACAPSHPLAGTPATARRCRGAVCFGGGASAGVDEVGEHGPVDLADLDPHRYGAIVGYRVQQRPEGAPCPLRTRGR